MPSPFIGGRIPQDLHDALQKHITESGEKLPQILQKALSNYLSYTPAPSQNRIDLEERVASLELLFRELKDTFEQTQQPLLSAEVEESRTTTPGQLSFLDDDIRHDIDTDIKKEEPDNSPDIEDENTDNSADIISDIDQQDKPDKQVEIISPQETAERTGLPLRTLRAYMSLGREVKRTDFIYKPVKGERKGESFWRAEPTPENS